MDSTEVSIMIKLICDLDVVVYSSKHARGLKSTTS